MASLLPLVCGLVVTAFAADIIAMDDVRGAIVSAGEHDDSLTMWAVMRSWELMILIAGVSICIGVCCCCKTKRDPAEQQAQ